MATGAPGSRNEVGYTEEQFAKNKPGVCQKATFPADTAPAFNVFHCPSPLPVFPPLVPFNPSLPHLQNLIPTPSHVCNLSFSSFFPTSQIMVLTDPEFESSMLISSDEGASFQKYRLTFYILSLLFHHTEEDWALAYSHDQKVRLRSAYFSLPLCCPLYIFYNAYT
ncbi:hypothetical protein CgunFtcFv8_022623 [Champsocephalus gunnari]|uniref:Sortilin N-terminal domain-containing protein n=1 Tax=Champsocephalus gunnari TaxID=52237 RepID=A0AAN8DPZ0_CHAGU|nr:hypothetical protein CgunFtcFv8_022623 [Champsocephalus gunnari]